MSRLTRVVALGLLFLGSLVLLTGGVSMLSGQFPGAVSRADRLATGTAMSIACNGSECALGETPGVMWQYLEWTLTNDSWSGNPFDVLATVVFEHATSGATHTTEMFYAGASRWKFRFTGTRTGLWRFTTSSPDPQLDGYRGTVSISPNPSPNIRGFLTHVGNKYAVMKNDITDLEGYVYQVFMNQQDFEQQYRHPSRILGAPGRAALIDDYWNNTQDNGFDIYFFAVFYSWFKMGALSIDDFNGGSDPDLDSPDLALFDTLEAAIVHAHSRGGRTHLWAWGDNDRKQTPNHIAGGIQGQRHKRLIRYIAARLGPVPGWSMSFGFDTIEMPGAESGAAWWARTMQSKMGWPHVLTSRGWDNPSFGAHSYAGFGGRYDLTTSPKGPASYSEIKQDMETRIDKPHIYEERHTYNRWRCWPDSVPDEDRLDETGSRRLIWWKTMAGGMGGFFGHFSQRFNAFGPFRPEGPCGYHPDSLKAAFRTHREFWRNGRLTLDMTTANQLTDGLALKTTANDRYVFYKEKANTVRMDISGASGSLSAFAVDTKAGYQEVDIGKLSPTNQTWTAPYTSDWAIAVGYRKPSHRDLARRSIAANEQGHSPSAGPIR